MEENQFSLEESTVTPDAPVVTDLERQEEDTEVSSLAESDNSSTESEEEVVSFSTVESAVAEGGFVLDGKGRMPGIYLDDLEQAERDRIGEVSAKASQDAEGHKVVSREINVTNSPLPPLTVTEKV